MKPFAPDAPPIGAPSPISPTPLYRRGPATGGGPRPPPFMDPLYVVRRNVGRVYR